VAATVLAKMGKLRYTWVPFVPLAWLAAATLTAGWQKVFSPDPKLGFLSHAASLNPDAPNAARMIFNDRIDAALALFYMAVVVVVILASAREWYQIAARKKTPKVNEAPFVESRLPA
jgi:carbon starvation protein